MKVWYIVLPATLAALTGCVGLAQRSSTAQEGTPAAPQAGGPSASQPASAGKPAPAMAQSQVPPVAPIRMRQPLSPTGSRFARLPDVNPDDLRHMDQSVRLAEQGNAAMAQGDRPQASALYQQALQIFPDDLLALDGLARCAELAGDPATAITYYRRAIYTSDPKQSSDGYRQNDVGRLMRYVLALGQTGQTDEALRVYNRGVRFFNYDPVDGQPRQKAPLPQIGDGPGQQPYTPRGLAAMAHLAIGVEAPGLDIAQIRMAVELAPNSAQAQFYLGEYLLGIDDVGAKAALTRAAQMGDAQTAAAAKVYLADVR